MHLSHRFIHRVLASVCVPGLALCEWIYGYDNCPTEAELTIVNVWTHIHLPSSMTMTGQPSVMCPDMMWGCAYSDVSLDHRGVTYTPVQETECGRIVYPTTSETVKTWEAGHAYIYNIDINNPDVLDKIEFDVTVDDFSIDQI